jgi:hypothetical protein
LRFHEQFFPWAFVIRKAVNCCLHLFAVSALANPHYPIPRLLPGVQDPNYIPGAKLGIQPRQERSAQADITRAGLLQKSIAARIDAPNREAYVNIASRFTPTLFASPFNAAESSHASR